MKKRIEEKKRREQGEVPKPPEPKKGEAPKEEVKKEPVDDSIQELSCPGCGKEFKVGLPEKKKETGKTICPRCHNKFSFRRKDWKPEGEGAEEEKKDTLTFPEKPKKPRVIGIDVIDLTKK